MLIRLRDEPKFRFLLSFVRMSYEKPSEYAWTDQKGKKETVPQEEGGEQEDLLMSALFLLGQHGALEAVQRNLRDGELLFSYLDDIYVLCRPD